MTQFSLAYMYVDEEGGYEDYNKTFELHQNN